LVVAWGFHVRFVEGQSLLQIIQIYI